MNGLISGRLVRLLAALVICAMRSDITLTFNIFQLTSWVHPFSPHVSTEAMVQCRQRSKGCVIRRRSSPRAERLTVIPCQHLFEAVNDALMVKHVHIAQQSPSNHEFEQPKEPCKVLGSFPPAPCQV